MLGWIKHNLESRLQGEISITSDMQMTPSLRRKWRRTKEPVDESEREEWKSWLKAQYSENKDHGIQSYRFMGNSWRNSETVADFIFLGSKVTADGDCIHEIKKCLLLGRKVMTNLDSILKSRDITLSTKVHLVKAMVFPVVMYGCEKESWAPKNWCWAPKNWCFWTVVLEKTLVESLGLQGDSTSPS